jgi:hypothetical protein
MPQLLELTGHARIDARSLALHRAVAAKLRANPALLDIARDNLARWMANGGPTLPYSQRWSELLDLPLEDLLAKTLEESEEMIAMRQCAPFAGILLPRESWAIYEDHAQKPRNIA